MYGYIRTYNYYNTFRDKLPYKTWRIFWWFLRHNIQIFLFLEKHWTERGNFIVKACNNKTIMRSAAAALIKYKKPNVKSGMLKIYQGKKITVFIDTLSKANQDRYSLSKYAPSIRILWSESTKTRCAHIIHHLA